MSPQVGCNDTPQRCEGDWSQAEWVPRPYVSTMMGALRSPAPPGPAHTALIRSNTCYTQHSISIGWKAIM